MLPTRSLLRALAVLRDDLATLRASVKFFNALLRLEMELDPETLVVRVDERVACANRSRASDGSSSEMPRSLIRIVT